MNTLTRLSHFWDRLSLYLPVLFMGLLALVSYWVLRSTPVPQAAQPERPVLHQPDYIMRVFSVRTFDTSGNLKTEIQGKEARHYPDNGSLEIDQTNIRSLSDMQHLTRATAARLTVNASHTLYQLSGNVKIFRTGSPTATGKSLPPTTYAGESLLVNTEANTITSNEPIVMTRGNDRITADRLHYDDTSRQAHLQGRVHTTLSARP